MIRIQDIADMAGVSRTTVANVIHGRTKKVSKTTLKKITALLNEVHYAPNMGSILLSGHSSKIIGLVVGYRETHGYNALQDPFVSSVLAVLEYEASRSGYYLMVIGGKDQTKIIDVASRWSIDGLIMLGFSEKEEIELKKKLNKPMVTIDTYLSKGSKFINVGIDDFSGGYQVGQYLLKMGYTEGIFLCETDVQSDLQRWSGFQQAMTEGGIACGNDRRILLRANPMQRIKQYQKLIPYFLEKKALFFSADLLAGEAVNFFYDQNIGIPEDLSIVGFDDTVFSRFIRPQLTTVQQNIEQKAILAFELLLKEIQNEPIIENDVKIPVKLIVRASVRENREENKI